MLDYAKASRSSWAYSKAVWSSLHMASPRRGRGLANRASYTQCSQYEDPEPSPRNKKVSGLFGASSWKRTPHLSLSYGLSLVAGAVVAWLWVVMLSQLCIGRAPGKVLPGEQIEDAVWAEGEGSLLLNRGGTTDERGALGNVDFYQLESATPDEPDQGKPWRKRFSVDQYPRTSTENIVFGIASSAELWLQRQEFTRLWWKPGLRGNVWVDAPENVDGWLQPEYIKLKLQKDPKLPEVRFSEDTSNFSYTHPAANRAAIRIARIIGEAVRLDVDDPSIHWYVLGDDDTIFSPANLAEVLSKYDHRRMYYIGAPSESLQQNVMHSYNMAYGGGGFAISVRLAHALARMQDVCMDRYPELYGSDARVQACIAELGVQVTRERGFHQLDLVGNMAGLLEAHPVTPFLSYHHVSNLQAVLPNKTSLESLQVLANVMHQHPREFLQQAICLDEKQGWTVSVAWGYSVRWYPEVLRPLDLERARMTFQSWNRLSDIREFSIDIRRGDPTKVGPPTSFFEMSRIGSRVVADVMYLESVYERSKMYVPRQPKSNRRLVFGRKKPAGDEVVKLLANDRGNRSVLSDDWSTSGTSSDSVKGPSKELRTIRVLLEPLGPSWSWHPRRPCCRSLKYNVLKTEAEIILGSCRSGEYVH